MDNLHDNEDYWSSSSSKAFNFDEDNEVFGINPTSTLKGETLFDDTISESSFECSATGGAEALSIKSILSEEALCLILEEQSVDECIVPKGITMEEELRLLRRKIQTTLYNPSPEATALKLVQGKNCSLEVFKSSQDKEQLLDAVFQLGGGDGVLRVLLFLKNSLNRDKFYAILKCRPKALQHYISFLKLCGNMDQEALEVMRHFNLNHEAFLLCFKSAMACNELNQRRSKLKALLEYSNKGIISVYMEIVRNSINLLDFIQKESNVLDNCIDINSTPLEVFFACCRKHPNWKEQDPTRSISPFRFCKDVNPISTAQFEWIAFNERIISGTYADVEFIFQRSSTWHPIKQKQFQISFSLETAIQRLHILKAPDAVLYFFLTQMSNSNDKLKLARQVKCSKAITDALVSLKDVSQLEKLKDDLPQRSEEQIYCEKALKNLQNKRWNTDNIKIKL